MFKGPIALGTIRTSLVLGLRLIIQAGTLLLVTRILGPEKFGAFAGVVALAVLLGTLSTFGANIIFFGQITKDPSSRGALLAYIIPTSLLAGSFLLFLFFLISPFLIKELNFSFWVIFFVGMADIVLQPLLGLVATEHHALGRVARSQLLHNAPLALRTMAAALVFSLKPSEGLLAYSTGYFFSTSCVLFVSVWCLPERWPGFNRWRLPTSKELSEGAGYAALNLTKSVPAELDKALALKLLPLEKAGVYAASSRVVGAITIPVTALILSALPRLFREGIKEKYGNDFMLSIYGASVIGGVVLSCSLWLFAPHLENIFGLPFQGVAELIKFLSFSVPAISIRLVSGSIFMALGKPWLRIGYEFLGASLLLVFSLVLVSGFGYKGLPYAVLFCEWFMAIAAGVLLLVIRRKGV